MLILRIFEPLTLDSSKPAKRKIANYKRSVNELFVNPRERGVEKIVLLLLYLFIFLIMKAICEGRHS